MIFHFLDMHSGGGCSVTRAFELGSDRYDSQPGESLRNPQLYPREFVDGYEHAVEAHQDRYTESRWEEGMTW